MDNVQRNGSRRSRQGSSRCLLLFMSCMYATYQNCMTDGKLTYYVIFETVD